MTTKEKIVDDMKKAAKGHDKSTLSIMRYALAAIQNKEKELRRELSEPELVQVLAGLVKKARESIEQFRAGNRDDLAAKEEHEVVILQSLLPQQLTPEELDVEISKVLEETGASSAQDLGKVMKHLMPKVAGRVDGKAVNERVRQRLSG